MKPIHFITAIYNKDLKFIAIKIVTIKILVIDLKKKMLGIIFKISDLSWYTLKVDFK
jgi:hypothetical protein